MHIPHEYSAFYTFTIFCIPQSAFCILPVPSRSWGGMLNTSGTRATVGEIHGAFAGNFDWPQCELSMKYMCKAHLVKRRTVLK